jgi:hypothetical protein
MSIPIIRIFFDFEAEIATDESKKESHFHTAVRRTTTFVNPIKETPMQQMESG